MENIPPPSKYDTYKEIVEVAQRSSLLVIQHDDQVARGLQRRAKTFFIDTRAATNFDAALDHLRNGWRPNVVICSYNLGSEHVDGSTVLEELLNRFSEMKPSAMRLFLTSADPNSVPSVARTIHYGPNSSLQRTEPFRLRILYTVDAFERLPLWVSGMDEELWPVSDGYSAGCLRDA